MPQQDPTHTPFPGVVLQTGLLTTSKAPDDRPYPTEHLGLFQQSSVLSISFVSRRLAHKSSASKGPERPSFFNAAFLATAFLSLPGIHSIFSSSRPLRSLRFLLRLLGSPQNPWRGGRACGTLHQKNPASQRVATAARVNHGGRYANLE